MAFRRSLTTFASVLALIALAASCGDDASTDSGPTTSAGNGGNGGSTTIAADPTTTTPDRNPDRSFSVLDALAEIPGDYDEPGMMISTGDLVAASAGADIERPTSLDGDVGDWLLAITGVRRDSPSAVFVPVASSFQINQAAAISEFHAELGWSILDADSFVEAAKAPLNFVVISGDLSDDVFDSADVVELPEGIVSAGEGEDHEVDVAGRTPARPLGTPLRMAVRDGRVAASSNTNSVAAWHDGDVESLAENDSWAAVARSLDGAGVYSAVLYRTGAEDGAGYDVVGIGWALDGDDPVITFAFHHADRARAEGHAADLRTMFQTGTSTRTGQPISELLALSDIAVDDNVVVATTTLGAEGNTLAPYSMLQAADGPFAGR